jgi:uncharacterized membrane protein YkgB
MLNLTLLARALRLKLGSMKWGSIAKSAGRAIICSVIMGAIVWVVSLFLLSSKDITIYGLFFGLMGSIIAGLVLYGGFSFLIKSPEFYEVLAAIKKEIRVK